MIKIVIYKSPKGDITGFKVTGHSGYASRGKDIVCSAISALAQTALLGLLKIAEADVEYKISEGFLQCSIRNVGSDRQRIMCEAILGTVCEGFKSIRESYIKYVDVVEEEV